VKEILLYAAAGLAVVAVLVIALIVIVEWTAQ
jgi:hypothetical protein